MVSKKKSKKKKRKARSGSNGTGKDPVLLNHSGQRYINKTGYEVIEAIDRRNYVIGPTSILFSFRGMKPGKMFYFMGDKKQANRVYAAGRSYGKSVCLKFPVGKIETVEIIEGIEISKYGCWCEELET